MTREDVLKLFPTASEEAISAILNMHHAELNAEKEKVKPNTEDKEKIKSLTEQLEALQNKDLSDAEKLQKQIDELTKANQTANQTIKDMETKNNLLSKGITAEDADKFIAGMKADNFDAGIIETMINNAVAAKEKKDLQNTPNHGASGNPDNESKKTESLAKEIAGSISGETKTSSDIVNAYA